MSYPSILRNTGFRNLWLGQAISQVGDAFYYVTFMFMVKKVTGSNAMVGYVGAAEMLPFLIFGPFAGVLADRIDRRKLMLWSDLASGGWLVALALMVLLLGSPPVWAIFASAFFLSTARAFFLPTKNASIPNLVAKEDLLEATSLSMATENVVKLAGLGVSAGMLALLYGLESNLFFVTAVAINSLSFFGSAVFIAKLPSIMPRREDLGEEPHPMRDFVEGLRYVKRRSVLVTLLLTQMGIHVLIAPFFVTYIASNDQWFGGKPQTLTWFEFAFFIGMIIGSAFVAKVKIVRPGISFAIANAILGLAVAAMAYSPWFWPYMLWNVVCGLALPFALIPMQTYMQMTVDDGFRGRVNSTLTTLSTSMMPVGMALGGVILERLGLVSTYLVMGLGIVAVAGAAVLGPAFRRAEMPRQDRPMTEQDAEPTAPGQTPEAAVA